MPMYPITKRRYTCEDSFFDDGNLAREIFAKECNDETDSNPCIAGLNLTQSINQSMDHHLNDAGDIMIRCNWPRCRAKFCSVQEYERHYSIAHSNSCQQCGANFPSQRLLELHISERHDTYFHLLAQKKPMYICLVESCSKRFQDDLARSQHLIAKHGYPKTFRFHRRQRKYQRPTQKAKCASNLEQIQVPFKKTNSADSAALSKSLSFHEQNSSDSNALSKSETTDENQTSTSSLNPYLNASFTKTRHKQVCKYFNTQSGCRKGNHCPFIHQSLAKSDQGEDINMDHEIDTLSQKMIQMRMPRNITFGRRGRR